MSREHTQPSGPSMSPYDVRWYRLPFLTGISDLQTSIGRIGIPRTRSSHNNNYTEHKDDQDLDGFHFRRHHPDWKERGVLLGGSGASGCPRSILSIQRLTLNPRLSSHTIHSFKLASRLISLRLRALTLPSAGRASRYVRRSRH